MIVYFCGVIGGSLAHSVTDYNVSLVGASGGCYAIIGAHVASVIVVRISFLQTCFSYEHFFLRVKLCLSKI